MILGRVVGQVWAARQHAGLAGHKLLLIQPLYWYEPPWQVAHLVAIDRLGAGPGDQVVVCLGEPARRDASDAPAPPKRASEPPGYPDACFLPIEAAVMAIVDQTHLSPDLTRPLRQVSAQRPPEAP